MENKLTWMQEEGRGSSPKIGKEKRPSHADVAGLELKGQCQVFQSSFMFCGLTAHNITWIFVLTGL